MLFFTSGLFFDDRKTAMRRRFRDPTEMNNTIIENWNRVVCDSDTVYIIGGVGEFGYLNSLNGIKILIPDSFDNKFYRMYVASVTPVRNSDYDREMFEIYAEQNYGIDHVAFSGRILIKLYSGRLVNLTTNPLETYDADEFNILGGIGEFQRMGKRWINADVAMNYMYPISETEIEDLIIKSKGKLLT